jgi:putative oxidoreductase
MAGGKNAGQDLGLLVLRLVLGGIFIAHGVQKLTGVGVGGFADFLGTLELPSPYPLAVATISAEIGGGLLVVLGVFPRIGALALAVVMGVAIWKVHWAKGFFMQIPEKEPGTFGFEYNLALLGMALCVLLAGAGNIGLFPKKGGGGPPAGPPK